MRVGSSHGALPRPGHYHGMLEPLKLVLESLGLLLPLLKHIK